MNWAQSISSFKIYLQLEKSLAAHSVVAYINDVRKFHEYCEMTAGALNPTQVRSTDLRAFLSYIHTLGLSPHTQARIISGLRSFYRFLQLENAIVSDPTEDLDMPRLGRKLPDTLSHEEIESMIRCIDLSKPFGMRDKAILEGLYGCGLRVSELINLRISNIYFDEGYIRVI